MIFEGHSASAGPAGNKTFAGTLFTVLLNNIMSLIGMLAAAFEILGSINGNISVIIALAPLHLAFCLIVCTLQVIMILVWVIAKTFGRRTYGFAIDFLSIVPISIEAILGKLSIILFI